VTAADLLLRVALALVVADVAVLVELVRRTR
jgi:hypothetical protein